MAEARQSVYLSVQVLSFVRAQAPETRHRLRMAFQALERNRGDIKALEGALAGYHRLRVGAVRMIFRYGPSETGGPAVYGVFAEHRSLVYLLLEDLLARGLTHSGGRKETPP